MNTIRGFLFAVGLLATPAISVAEEIEWQIAPYIWAAGVKLDLSLNGNPVLGDEVSFGDLVDKLDGAFMLHTEARSGRFGGFLDLVTISLSDSSVTPIGPGGPVVGDVAIDTSLDLDLIELGGAYRFAESEAVVADILVGVRFVNIEQDLRITLPGPPGTELNPAIDVSETDYLIGARVLGQWTDRWGYSLRGDYAGGGTDGTVNLIGTIGYSFNDLFTLAVGYRYLSLELSENLDIDATSESEIDMSGPVIGFVFDF